MNNSDATWNPSRSNRSQTTKDLPSFYCYAIYLRLNQTFVCTVWGYKFLHLIVALRGIIKVEMVCAYGAGREPIKIVSHGGKISKTDPMAFSQPRAHFSCTRTVLFSVYFCPHLRDDEIRVRAGARWWQHPRISLVRVCNHDGCTNKDTHAPVQNQAFP